MNLSSKLMISFMIVLSSMIIFASLLPIHSVIAKKKSKNFFDLEPNQSFSGGAGSTIEYNIYIENKGKSAASYSLAAVSDKGYYIEVWRETDNIGNGDIRLTPPQGSGITISAGEVATLIVKVSIPSDAIDGTIDNTMIEVIDTDLGDSDAITVSTTVDSNLPYPSNWIQLGSDPAFTTPPPEKIDIKALYYTNNGTDVFFRMAEASKPDARPFLYFVCLDTKTGGQQIDGYYYDYLLSSDGVLYMWNGVDWINSDYSVYWQIDGSSIVLWTNLENLYMDIQEINILAFTTTKDWVLKDSIGAYHILRNNISEIPLLLLPILIASIYFAIFWNRKHLFTH